MDPSRQHEHASSATVPLVSPLAQLAYVFSEYSTARATPCRRRSTRRRAHTSPSVAAPTSIVSDRRRHDYDEGTLVRYASARSTRREWFTDLERRVDVVCGVPSGVDRCVARFHRDALDAVPADAEALVVYNYAGAVTDRLVRRFGGKVVLHLGNDVFRSWRASEIRRVIDRTHVTVAVSDYLVATTINRTRPPTREPARPAQRRRRGHFRPVPRSPVRR